MTLIIAHRGASGYELENTLAAFRRASDMGADGVELDVHATSDGEIVVHHDAEVDGKDLRGLTLEEVKSHVLANGERIPTLAEALDVIEGTAYVEVKALPESADKELFEVIFEGKRGRVTAGSPHPLLPSSPHVHSFEHRLIRRLHDKHPELTCGALGVAVPVNPERMWDDAAATEVWQDQQFITTDLVERAHRSGRKIIAWTVDDRDRMKALIDMGVDGICTNKPDVGKQCLT